MPRSERDDVQRRERNTIDDAREQGIGTPEEGVEPTVLTYAETGGVTDLGVNEPVVPKPLQGDHPPERKSDPEQRRKREGQRQQRMVLRIRGRVQGVNYRVSARRMAVSLGIEAKPENLPDGSVRVSMSGAADAIAEFRTWCAEGPTLAQVDSVEEESPGDETRDTADGLA